MRLNLLSLQVMQVCRKFFKEQPEGIVVLTAYTIGKERLVLACQDALNLSAYVDESKLKTLRLLGGEYVRRVDAGLFVSNKSKARLHVARMGFGGDIWPYFQPNFANLEEYAADLRSDHGLAVSGVLCICPTGWATSTNWNKKNAVVKKDSNVIQLVPYSEHSQFEELNNFVRFLRPMEVVPTVFSGEANRRNIVDCFRNLVDKAGAATAFFAKHAALIPQIGPTSPTNCTGITATAMSRLGTDQSDLHNPNLSPIDWHMVTTPMNSTLGSSPLSSSPCVRVDVGDLVQ